MSRTCPACPRTPAAGQYLCHICWRRLPDTARTQLNRRDRYAVRRLQQLLNQIRAGKSLTDIRIE